MVGKKTDSGTCRVLTLANVGNENYVEFPVPSNKATLSPGEPKWANYVKGVVANYKGIHVYTIFILDKKLINHFFVQIKNTDIYGLIWFIVFNATFNNISVRSVLLVEETGVPGENHRPVAGH